MAQTGAFSTNLPGLQPFTRYYFTSFAQNTAGSAWAPAALDFAVLDAEVVMVGC